MKAAIYFARAFAYLLRFSVACEIWRGERDETVRLQPLETDSGRGFPSGSQTWP